MASPPPFPPSKYLPNQKHPAGTAWESIFKMEILLVKNVTRSMRPKNMASSDLKTIIAKAENQMNGLCFCCIQNVNANSTVKIKYTVSSICFLQGNAFIKKSTLLLKLPNPSHLSLPRSFCPEILLSQKQSLENHVSYYHWCLSNQEKHTAKGTCGSSSGLCIW